MISAVTLKGECAELRAVSRERDLSHVSLGRSRPSCYILNDPELLVAERTEKAGVGGSTPSLATIIPKELV
jgi:hypothetical protein